jgi:flagellar protein FliO/FliZ
MNALARQTACLAAALFAPAATAASLPATAPVVDTARWLAGLATVLAAIVLCAWLLRRLGRFSRLAPGRFRVLGAVSLGARERAVLLQAGGKQLVVGVAPGRVQTLCVLEGADQIPPEPDLPPPALPPFAQQLAAALTRKPRG